MKKSILKPASEKILDKGVERELYASNLYKAMANFCQMVGLFGAQAYFKNESAEELEHYQKLVDYANDMGYLIEVPTVKAVEDMPNSLSQCLSMAYDFEKALMMQYQKSYEEAEEAGDCITASFLIEFMQIQRMAVGGYGDLIARLELAPNDLLEFDEYMGELVK